MGKRSGAAPTGVVPAPEWDPNQKELWHKEFEQEPVNEEKWSCVVTAAIPVEATDEECILMYTQCVNAGLRKVLKVISMSDVVKLLRKNATAENPKVNRTKGKSEKPEKIENIEKNSVKFPNARSNQIVNLAANYATFTDVDCKLPPDLMAGVLKYIILNLKDENCFQKKVNAVKERKLRERELKAKFIRNLKPYKPSQDEGKSFRKIPPNVLELDEPISDEPLNGPDLYIMLTDIYDLYCFPELVRLNVPFLAILKISIFQDEKLDKGSVTFVPSRADATSKKVTLISEFWEKLKDNCIVLEKTKLFKDIAMVHYQTTLHTHTYLKDNLRNAFDQLTWMQYCAYNIYRHYQMYLQDLYVQRLVLSLEPLDLGKCDVYNKICNALVTGEPITFLLILFAMIEQVVAGVPETAAVAFEYEPTLNDFFAVESRQTKRENVKYSREQTTEYTTPCKQCRDKIQKNFCETLKNISIERPSRNDSKTEGPNENSDANSQFQNKNSLLDTSSESLSIKTTYSDESGAGDNLLDAVLAEKKAKDIWKKYKGPSLCFYGDQVFLQMYHCDPRILTAETVINRFLKNPGLFQIWKKYPELPPPEQAYYNFNFQRLLTISKESEESLKLKIHFTISLKLIGITKWYLYKGDEENASETVFSSAKDKMKKSSKVKFEENAIYMRSEERNFFQHFFKTIVADAISHDLKSIKIERDLRRNSLIRPGDNDSLRKAIGQFNMTIIAHRSSGMLFPLTLRSGIQSSSIFVPQNNKELSNLFTLLDCLDISNLAELHFVHDEIDYQKMIQSFKYFEELEAEIMIQRLIEATENFNTVHYSYFAPTDTILAIMINDFDHRGIFFTHGQGVLPTPVSLRDFLNYVYNEISEWLVEKENAYLEFISELQEEIKTQKEKKDKEYLTYLRRQYCLMSQEEKQKFLETDEDFQMEPQVTEEELEDLPFKRKFSPTRKTSFITTNLSDVRVEINQKVNEFYSKDGTAVNVVIDTWLYEPLSLLTLVIRRPKLRLYYYQCLGETEVNTAFTFKTTSDIIFSFSKGSTDKKEDFNYDLSMSWPTGLVIQPLSTSSGLYIKQGYLKPYRHGWEIEEEKSRCCLKNGQVVIFKENGDLTILCSNGTIYIFYESKTVPRYEIISPTGEVWEVRTSGPSKYRKKLQTTQKIFIGTDPKTEETFYRRDDGLNCMLWPSGKLITTYPDGTKITSTPRFDEEEITNDWTEDEKIYFHKIESKRKMEQEVMEPRSRTILRNPTPPATTDSKILFDETFVSVSCSFLIEHPKYSTVLFNPEDPYITLTMPEDLKVLVYPEGNYRVQKINQFLSVQGSCVEFYSSCNNCENQSMVTINLDRSETLCKFVDYFRNSFVVHRNGKTTYKNYFRDSDEADTDRNNTGSVSSKFLAEECINQHFENSGDGQRCFALNRDLSGVEFIHEEVLATYCHDLPENTYYDFHLEEPQVGNTFTSPYHKIGFENWEMNYQDKNNSLPTNLKKKDLKELGVKDTSTRLFKYPFPKHHNCSETQKKKDENERKIDMPKIIVARTIKWLSPNKPDSIIQSIHSYILEYQKKSHEIFLTYKNNTNVKDLSSDYRHTKMRLHKIALTLSQSLNMYPHLCTQTPSTEKDIHYFGHFIQQMEEFKSHTKDDRKYLPDCKQIPTSLPRSSNLPPIKEECDP